MHATLAPRRFRGYTAAPVTDLGYSSRRAACFDGARVALGVPSAVLAAGYLGFAALAKAGQFPLWAALLSTATVWALPGQLVMIEMHNAGALPTLIVIAVTFTAMRFLPMTVSFMPLLREPRQRAWHAYFAAHVLAMTNWALSIGPVRKLPMEQRLPYFVGFAATTWIACIVATAVGYFLAGAFSPLVNHGLVLISPLYFVLILSGEYRNRIGIASLAFGALAGPLLFRVAPEWSVMLGGLIGGTAAYWLFRRRA
jgi:predicted branched-subunit amino acid permease